jgi:hypothetical protein
MRIGRLWLLLLAMPALAGEAQLAFPGAVGFGVDTPGGRGGRVIAVSSLASGGPGTLRAALETEGPRIVVFSVGGVIDLAGRSLTVSEPFLTVAGQTAPSPGITLIRGSLRVATHDVVLRHVRVRPGDCGKPKGSGWEPDGVTTYTAADAPAPGANNIVVDHCSLTWAVDENLSASGPQHEGRERTSHRITFSNNIVAEGLANSSHAKGEHSKGTLVHDHAREIAILANLYACNTERNPMLKPDAEVVVANNLIYNPAKRAIHTSWSTNEYAGRDDLRPATLVAVGNVLWAGPDTRKGVALIAVGAGKANVFARDNVAFDLAGGALPEVVGGPNRLAERPVWPARFVARAAVDVADHVLANAGARPWDRDAVDERIVDGVRSRSGRVIDSQEQVGGYPTSTSTRRALSVPADAAAVDAWLESFIPAP